MTTLSREEAEERLKDLRDWTFEGTSIWKQFTFPGFPEAVAFVSRMVPEAEAADHHPDITIKYRRVTLVYTTHSEGGLTQKDFDGAKMADQKAKPTA